VVEVVQQLGLPREVGVAAVAEPSDGKVSVDAHTPHLVGDTGPEPVDASDVVTPPIEYLPPHGPIFASSRDRQEVGFTRR
jgi:hypothetical protein